ncbi:MAG: fasciclin domain-containing protein [Cyanobacteria bacterium P01_D01_bin.36]
MNSESNSETNVEQPELTIAGVVTQSGGEFDENNQDFDILLTALGTADLVDVVSDSAADLTVFAPTDAAFVQLANDFGFEGSDESGAFDTIVSALTDLGGGDPIPVLQDVLKYHVSAEAKTLEEIQSSDTVSTLLDGATLTPDGDGLIDNEPDIADAQFVAGLTDLQTSNGTIQGIDRVLIPLDIPGNEPPAEPETPTIAEIVSQSGGEFDDNNQDFDILLTALGTADLVDAVGDPAADLTVFAPTDAAFVQLANDFGFEGSDESGAFDAIVSALTDLGGGDPIPVLQDVLQYHVSVGAQTLEEIQGSDTVSTLLEGATLTPDGDGLIDNEPDIADAQFVTGLTDIQAGNGLIQSIDRVLIPLDIPGNESTEDSRPVIRGLLRNDVLTAEDGGSQIFGDQGKDTILGSAAADLLSGDRGDDTLTGNGGEDELLGGDGRDTLLGGAQADILNGGNGTDRLEGNGGDDILLGGRGKDILIGSADGSQLFDGGRGKDQLFLEGGTDTVVLRAGDGADEIFGFDLGQTTLGLSDGLQFSDLTFTQGDGFSSIFKGRKLLATVDGITADSLNSESSFAVL